MDSLVTKKYSTPKRAVWALRSQMPVLITMEHARPWLDEVSALMDATVPDPGCNFANSKPRGSETAWLSTINHQSHRIFSPAYDHVVLHAARPDNHGVVNFADGKTPYGGTLRHGGRAPTLRSGMLRRWPNVERAEVKVVLAAPSFPFTSISTSVTYGPHVLNWLDLSATLSAWLGLLLACHVNGSTRTVCHSGACELIASSSFRMALSSS